MECSPDIAIERLKGRGLTVEEAKARLASQWSNEEREKYASVIILNNGSREALEEEIKKYLYFV